MTKLRPLAAAISAICTLSAHAADDPARVEVKGNTEQYDARKDDTATKIVVTAEEIQKHGDTVLSDVLKRQPGVTVSGGNAGRGGGEIRMRGLGNGYTQILLNGEPAPPGFSVDSLPPDSVERIEIVRAATAEFSTQAIAGTINIVLRKQVRVAQRELKTNLSGAGNFISPMAMLQLSDKNGRLSYSINANANYGRFDQTPYQIDEADDAAGNPLLRRRADRFGKGNFANLHFSPRLNYTLENGDTLTSQTFVNLNRVSSENGATWSSTLGPLPLYARETTQITNHGAFFRTDLNWIHKLGDNAKLDTKVGVNANYRDTEFFQQGYDSANRMILDSQTPVLERGHALTFTGKYTMPFAEGHTLAMGWDTGLGWRHEERNQADKPIAGQVPVIRDQEFDADFSRAALFVQDEWNVTPKWSVYLGLRWETLKTKSEGNDFVAMNNRSSVVSPIFQTLWKLPDSKNDQVRFAVTRTYKAPALERMIPRVFFTPNNSAVSPDSRGNPALKPELAWGVDASYEHYFGEGGMLSASTYLRQISEFTRRDVQLIDGRWVALPVNDGDAQSRGIELEAKFPLKHFLKDGPAIDLRANLARNWSSVSNVPGPNNRLADQVPLSANLGVDYKVDAAWTVGGTFAFKTGGLIRISEQSSTYATVKRELDLYALWKVNPKLQVRMSALNVLGQDFYNAEYYNSQRFTNVFPVTQMFRIGLEFKL
jgi:outer membrane receptor protein involved in Fe transport